MRPSAFLLKLLTVWLLCALALAVLRIFRCDNLNTAAIVWWCVGAVFAFAAAIDFMRRNTSRAIDVQRVLPASFALGVANHAEFILHNNSRHTLHIQIDEQRPAHIHIEGLPATLTLKADTKAAVRFRCIPHLRGDTEFAAPWLRVRSRWHLWEFLQRVNIHNTVHVFPNFVPLTWFAGMDFSRQMGALGVHRVHRRGEGMEFHQLRAFREGDNLRQIDWKASSRYHKPISREYREERDQAIIFLLDSGRRMRAKDGELSHFDHALNALLVTSQIALRQGDAVGLLSFAGDERWLAPTKGQRHIQHLLHSIYDLHSSVATADFSAAAAQLLKHQRKRALIILLTTLHEEDSEDLQAAVALLRKHHLLLVANLREYELEQKLLAPVVNIDDALLYAGVGQARVGHEKLFARLRHQRVNLIDTLPQHLHRELANQYWQMKLSGMI